MYVPQGLICILEMIFIHHELAACIMLAGNAFSIRESFFTILPLS